MLCSTRNTRPPPPEMQTVCKRPSLHSHGDKIIPIRRAFQTTWLIISYARGYYDARIALSKYFIYYIRIHNDILEFHSE